MRISYWSSDVCSSDLVVGDARRCGEAGFLPDQAADFLGYASGGGDTGLVPRDVQIGFVQRQRLDDVGEAREYLPHLGGHGAIDLEQGADEQQVRSEEPTSELQSLMGIAYSVFCLKKKKSMSSMLTANMK